MQRYAIEQARIRRNGREAIAAQTRMERAAEEARWGRPWRTDINGNRVYVD